MNDPSPANFCASFLDLLGQRDAMRGQGLILLDGDGEPSPEVKQSIRESVMVARSFQQDAQDFIDSLRKPSLRDALNDEGKVAYDAVKAQPARMQRWSDGLVLYATMVAAAPMDAIYEVMCTSAYLCFLQLAKRYPIRGGIDISWGSELHDNELYGAIIANSYHLESDVAQYPRIVVHKRLVDYLDLAITGGGVGGSVEMVNAQLARLCRSFISSDSDGCFILDYLAPTMRELMGTDSWDAIYTRADRFVHQQYRHFIEVAPNPKLARRYRWLLDYFERSYPRGRD